MLVFCLNLNFFNIFYIFPTTTYNIEVIYHNFYLKFWSYLLKWCICTIRVGTSWGRFKTIKLRNFTFTLIFFIKNIKYIYTYIYLEIIIFFFFFFTYCSTTFSSFIKFSIFFNLSSIIFISSLSSSSSSSYIWLSNP